MNASKALTRHYLGGKAWLVVPASTIAVVGLVVLYDYLDDLSSASVGLWAVYFTAAVGAALGISLALFSSWRLEFLLPVRREKSFVRRSVLALLLGSVVYVPIGVAVAWVAGPTEWWLQLTAVTVCMLAGQCVIALLAVPGLGIARTLMVISLLVMQMMGCLAVWYEPSSAFAFALGFAAIGFGSFVYGVRLMSRVEVVGIEPEPSVEHLPDTGLAGSRAKRVSKLGVIDRLPIGIRLIARSRGVAPFAALALAMIGFLFLMVVLFGHRLDSVLVFNQMAVAAWFIPFFVGSFGERVIRSSMSAYPLTIRSANFAIKSQAAIWVVVALCGALALIIIGRTEAPTPRLESSTRLYAVDAELGLERTDRFKVEGRYVLAETGKGPDYARRLISVALYNEYGVKDVEDIIETKRQGAEWTVDSASMATELRRSRMRTEALFWIGTLLLIGLGQAANTPGRRRQARQHEQSDRFRAMWALLVLVVVFPVMVCLIYFFDADPQFTVGEWSELLPDNRGHLLSFINQYFWWLFGAGVAACAALFARNARAARYQEIPTRPLFGGR
jgi:hypothetical protein